MKLTGKQIQALRDILTANNGVIETDRPGYWFCANREDCCSAFLGSEIPRLRQELSYVQVSGLIKIGALVGEGVTMYSNKFSMLEETPRDPDSVEVIAYKRMQVSDKARVAIARLDTEKALRSLSRRWDSRYFAQLSKIVLIAFLALFDEQTLSESLDWVSYFENCYRITLPNNTKFVVFNDCVYDRDSEDYIKKLSVNIVYPVGVQTTRLILGIRVGQDRYGNNEIEFCNLRYFDPDRSRSIEGASINDMTQSDAIHIAAALQKAVILAPYVRLFSETH